MACTICNGVGYTIRSLELKLRNSKRHSCYMFAVTANMSDIPRLQCRGQNNWSPVLLSRGLPSCVLPSLASSVCLSGLGDGGVRSSHVNANLFAASALLLLFHRYSPPQNPPALLLVMCLAGSKKRAAQLQQARGKDCLPCLTGAERHKIQQFPKTCSKKAVHTMGTVA